MALVSHPPVPDRFARWADHPFLTIFTDLLRIASPPAHEWGMRREVRRRITDLGFESTTDPLGNLLVRLPGRQPDAPLAVLASHMDEIALVVTRIEPDGELKVTNSGGILPDKLGEGPVELIGDRDEVNLVGVVSTGSGHVPAGSRAAPRWEDVRLITGLSPQQLAEAGIRVGSTAVPCAWRRGPVLLGDPDNPLLGAWTFDDRAGVVTLLRLLERIKRDNLQPAWPTIIAFTTQEEGGCHGAIGLAQRERPEVFIAVDGTPMPPGSPLMLDGRPCAWSKDELAHSDQRLVRQIIQAAAQAGVSVQTTVLGRAYSDASRVLAAGAAPRVVTFGHVRENSHGFEVAPLRGFDHLLNTLKVLIQQSYAP